MNRFIIIILFFLPILAGGFFLTKFSQNRPEQATEKDPPRISIVASNLEVPWALAFLPDGRLLVTERVGKVRIVNKDLNQEEPITITGVKQIGEGGLLGIAIHPSFNSNHYIYLYYTYLVNGDNTLNKVVRFRFENNKLIEPKTVVDQIPGAQFHNGGRLKFGPDNYLYITTGDAQNPSQSQDKKSLTGKILRVKAGDGEVEIYSYGHRNPQGIAWDDKGNLFETEHGQSAQDEFNSIQKDGNYGWPNITGDETAPGITSPILQSGKDTWAPGGLAFYNGSFYFTGLRGQALYQVKFEGGPKLLTHFKGEFGRIRDVVLGPDNNLYFTTSNRDGRGNPNPEDDRVIKINPNNL